MLRLDSVFLLVLILPGEIELVLELLNVIGYLSQGPSLFDQTPLLDGGLEFGPVLAILR